LVSPTLDGTVELHGQAEADADAFGGERTG